MWSEAYKDLWNLWAQVNDFDAFQLVNRKILILKNVIVCLFLLDEKQISLWRSQYKVVQLLLACIILSSAIEESSMHSGYQLNLQLNEVFYV